MVHDLVCKLSFQILMDGYIFINKTYYFSTEQNGSDRRQLLCVRNNCVTTCVKRRTVPGQSACLPNSPTSARAVTWSLTSTGTATVRQFCPVSTSGTCRCTCTRGAPPPTMTTRPTNTRDRGWIQTLSKWRGGGGGVLYGCRPLKLTRRHSTF